MQALYQWQQGGGSRHEIEQQFLANPLLKGDERPPFSELFNGAIATIETIDQQLAPCLEQRTIEEVDPVERAILRIAAWELLNAREIGAAIVISDWVALANKYGAEKGHRYVNGVLDQLARRCRGEEMAKGRS